MNPNQEYLDPITCHYKYSGGVEGPSIIEWFRESTETDQGASEEGEWEPIEGVTGVTYQPYVDDYNRRIKIFITPVKEDGESPVPNPLYLIRKHLVRYLAVVLMLASGLCLASLPNHS